MYPVGSWHFPTTFLDGSREEPRARKVGHSVRLFGGQPARSIVGYQKNDRRGNVQDRPAKAMEDRKSRDPTKIDDIRRITRTQSSGEGRTRMVQTLHEGKIHSTIFPEYYWHVFPLGDKLYR